MFGRGGGHSGGGGRGRGGRHGRGRGWGGGWLGVYPDYWWTEDDELVSGRPHPRIHCDPHADVHGEDDECP